MAGDKWHKQTESEEPTDPMTRAGNVGLNAVMAHEECPPPDQIRIIILMVHDPGGETSKGALSSWGYNNGQSLVDDLAVFVQRLSESQ